MDKVELRAVARILIVAGFSARWAKTGNKLVCETESSMRRRKRHNALLISALGAVTLALSCGLGALAMRQGVIRPPYMQIQVGSVRLVGITSARPTCTQWPIAACAKLDQQPTFRVFRIWLLVQREPGSWSQAHVTQLLAFQVGE